MKHIHIPVAIVGGGIAGLWTYNLLRSNHINACLIEKNNLGSGQTILSQGIIHGGIKYALNGKPSGASTSIGSMPARWQHCLNGTGELNLSDVTILSHHHHLCQLGGITSRLKNQLCNHLVRSDTTMLQPADYPAPLHHSKFKGSILQIDETILDIRSLLSALQSPFPKQIIQATAHTQLNAQGQIKALLLDGKEQQVTLTADYYIFCAGEGNEQLSTDLAQAPAMQRRPLHQVWVTLPKQAKLFAHFIQSGNKPTLSITSHVTDPDKTLWYLGGNLAEQGTELDASTQIKRAQQSLTTIMPWLDLKQATWGSIKVNRAEHAQPRQQRPDNAGILQSDNAIICYPVKLTNAPGLGRSVMQLIKTARLRPAVHTDWLTQLFASPQIANYPWTAT